MLSSLFNKGLSLYTYVLRYILYIKDLLYKVLNVLIKEYRP